MKAQRLSTEEAVRPFQVSLRVRHPSLDPAEISKALELEPEHCFGKGEPRQEGGRRGVHPQTYWLAPVDMEQLRQGDPSFLGYFEDQTAAKWELSAEKAAAIERNFREAAERHGSCQLEGLLFSLLARLNLRQEFLARIQREGGDISVLVMADPAAVRIFTLSVPIARFLAKLNIDVEFELDAGG
jgi:hypothetical protein